MNEILKGIERRTRALIVCNETGKVKDVREAGQGGIRQNDHKEWVVDVAYVSRLERIIDKLLEQRNAAIEDGPYPAVRRSAKDADYAGLKIPLAPPPPDERLERLVRVMNRVLHEGLSHYEDCASHNDYDDERATPCDCRTGKIEREISAALRAFETGTGGKV
jgi:hypothetical protein